MIANEKQEPIDEGPKDRDDRRSELSRYYPDHKNHPLASRQPSLTLSTRCVGLRPPVSLRSTILLLILFNKVPPSMKVNDEAKRSRELVAKRLSRHYREPLLAIQPSRFKLLILSTRYVTSLRSFQSPTSLQTSLRYVLRSLFDSSSIRFLVSELSMTTRWNPEGSATTEGVIINATSVLAH